MSLEDAIKQIEKEYGKGAIMSLDDSVVEPLDVISTSSIGLNKALGVGGIPKGRITEVFGPESSGKTTLCLHIIAECQKAGGKAAFIDAEHSLDIYYAEKLGVKRNELLLSQPDNGEQALNIVETLVRSEEIDLIIIDSVAALTPKAEIEGEMGDSHMGLQARLMSQALRKLTGITSKTNTAIVFVNQIRQKIGMVFGNPETTSGGNALKFYASIRIDIRKTGQIKDKEEVVGNKVRIKIVKNKVASPFKVHEGEIAFGIGLDIAAELLDHLCEAGIIEKTGAWYRYGEEKIQGNVKAKQFVRDSYDKFLKELNDGNDKK